MLRNPSKEAARPYLAVEELSKSFPGTRALDGVSLTVRRGEVHAVIGENGAGKSTLLLILSGVHTPDSGWILIDGQEVRLDAPRAAIAAGIGTVFQELSLVNGLSVAENVFGNRAPVDRLGLVDFRRLRRATAELLALLGSPLRPDDLVGRLSPGDRQIVEIARALSMHAQVLLLDEPTSALSHAETDRLFRVLDRLRHQGVAIVFVSHRLAEVFEIADRVSILRDGRLVASYPRNAIDHDLAVRSMVGRVLSDLYPERAGTPGPTRLEARGLRSGPVGPVDLALHAGEIVGLAGLQGSGRSRLARALGGVERYDGEVRIDGRPVRLRGPWSAARHGIVFVPADRAGEGLFPRMTVGQNLVAMALAAVSRLGIVRPRAERALVARLLRDFGIRASGPGQLASRLSGGNQQKTMLARSLAVAPRVLVIDEPTQGIDVGARAEIHQLLRRLASDGVAVLMVSSDLPEILGMCDRVAVMAGGTVQKVLPGVATTEERVMALAVGARDRTGGAGHA